MLKILYITNGITGSGGLERVLSVKAGYLAGHFDYEVHILTLNEQGKKPFYEFSDKIKIHSIAVSGNPLQYLKGYSSGIKKAVSEIKPDVISVCDDGLKGFFLPKILKKPCPMVYERHVSKLAEINDKNKAGFRRILAEAKFSLMNRLAKDFDRFILLTNDNKTEWNLNNIQVISNPLSFYPEENSNLGNKIVIAVGKQSYQKGYDRLLQSWAKVQQKHPDWKLHIYGKFDASQNLELLAKTLQVDHTVSFFEPVKNISDKYLGSSIYVMSSRFEGFGMVLIEAMACGVPCISYDCPCGPTDIIENGNDGFLIENGNIKAFAAKINLLIEDENLRGKLGHNAKENVRRFLPENIVQQWDVLFKSLAK